MINYDIKFITSEETLHLKTGDFKSFKYETKKRIDESISTTGKRAYIERRGGHWRAPRPRQIRQLESKLRDRTVIACEWTNDKLVTIVFCSGAIAYLSIKPDTLDVTQILFDRYFVGKLSGQTVSSVALCKSHILFTHTDKTATLVTFGKSSVTNIPCRISDRDPQLQNIELGGSNRRAERYISWTENNNSIWALVWTVTSAEPAPWSPVLEDHANLHLYEIQGQSMNLIIYHQLENETLLAELSHKNDNIIHIVEQLTCQKNGVTVEWSRYEAGASSAAGRLVCAGDAGGAGGGGVAGGAGARTCARLSAPARAGRRSGCGARVLLACIDGTVCVLHHAAGLTHTAKPGFIATDVRWAGELIIAAEEGGRLQCYDRALSLLNHHTKCFDLTSYLRDTKRFKILATRSAKCGPLVLASFSGGLLALLHITHPKLITAWIRARRTSNAVALLRAMDWDEEGNECLWAANKLVCASLRSGAEAVACEGCATGALGAFLAPRAPHSHHALRYAAPAHDLARKLFHHLLRRGRVEKALSLGVDLCAWDLFVDARWGAARRGSAALAAEAHALAQQHASARTDSECSGSCSECSSHSCCDSDEGSISSEAMKAKQPPLPRVSLANHPTLLPVNISPPEHLSTASIRPNLHQYLERDTTIWKKDIRDDTYLKNNYTERLKPILSQSSKWHSVDGFLNYKTLPKSTLSAINEGSAMTSHPIIDMIPRAQETQYKHLYQTELREELPNTLYRYQYNNYNHPSTSINYNLERQGNRPERNKVKFSDTVTIAVMSDSAGSPERSRDMCEAPVRCAPHKYAGFASAAVVCPPPAPAAPPAPPPPPHPPAPATEDNKQKPPKIKVVHFGMV